MAEEYTDHVPDEIETRVAEKLSQEVRRTESCILGALSELNQFLNPQVRTCSVAVPGTSRNNHSENRDSTGDRSLDDPCREVVFSGCQTSNLKESEQEVTLSQHVCEACGQTIPSAKDTPGPPGRN